MSIDFRKAAERLSVNHQKLEAAIAAFEKSAKLNIVQVAREFDVTDDVQVTLARHLVDLEKACQDICESVSRAYSVTESALETLGD